MKVSTRDLRLGESCELGYHLSLEMKTISGITKPKRDTIHFFSLMPSAPLLCSRPHCSKNHIFSPISMFKLFTHFMADVSHSLKHSVG